MSFILLGILNSQASGAVAAAAYDLLETVDLASEASSISFTSINSTYGSDYKHLQVRGVVSNSGTSDFLQNLTLSINGYTSGSAYARHDIGGNGSSVDSEGVGGLFNNIIFEDIVPGNADTWVGAFVLDILDAFSTNKYVTVRMLGGGHTTSETDVHLYSGLLRHSEAVDTLLFGSTQGNFRANNRMSLYGIRG